MTLKKSAAIAVAAVCVAGAAAGCSSSTKTSGGTSGGSSSTGGSGGGGQTDLAGYVTKAADSCSSSSAKLDLKLNIAAAGTTTTMSGTGAENPMAKTAQMQISLAIPGAGNLDIQEIVDGTTAYMKSAVFGSDKWIKLDLAQLVGSGSLGTASNPCDTLSVLKNVHGAAVTKVGDDTVNGVSATHYQVKMDLNTILAKSPLKKLLDQLGTTANMPSTIPVDLWIDGQGRPAQMKMNIDLTVQGQAVKEDMTINLHDWGSPISVNLPDPSQVEAAPPSLLSGLLGGGTT